MILLKLGGSIITNKKRALSARRRAIDSIMKGLKKIKGPVVIVHGGGSYGHYWSVKYDMHTRPAKYDLRGVSTVKNSMIELDKIVLDSMLKNRLRPYSVPPACLMRGDRPITGRIRELEGIARSGLVPVTYGDALWYGQKKSYILSGDRIMTHVARVLRPRLSIFALDVDGVYSDLKTKNLIREVRGEKVSVSDVRMDVTGGMGRKMKEAANISKMGLRVFFANGNRPERIVSAANRNKFEGTLFKSR